MADEVSQRYDSVSKATSKKQLLTTTHTVSCGVSFCVVLCRVVLCCVVCGVSFCVVVCRFVLCCVVLCCVVLGCVALCCGVLCRVRTAQLDKRAAPN